MFLKTVTIFLMPLLLTAAVSCAKRELVPIVPFEGAVTADLLKNVSVFGDVESLRSNVVVELSKDGLKAGSYRGAIAYRNPDSMRVRVFDPFGLTVLDVLTDAGIAQVFVPMTNTVLEGEFPVFGMPKGDRYKIEEDKSGYILYGLDPSGKTVLRKYVFDRFLRINAVHINNERYASDIYFSNFSGSLPLLIKMKLSNGFAVDMKLDDTEIDPELGEEIFFPMGHEGKLVLPLKLLYKGVFPFK